MTNKISILVCDVHLHAESGELAEYCEIPSRKAVETLDAEATLVSTLAYGAPIVPGLAPGAGDGADTPWPGVMNRPIVAESPEQWREDLDSMGIGPDGVDRRMATSPEKGLLINYCCSRGW